MRLWEWPAPAVVLGSAGRLAEDVNETACRDDGVPVSRRASGGGTVLLGQGCLLFSLVLDFRRAPALREILSSYRHILEQMCMALHDVLPGIERAGQSDLAAAGRKFSGNAQQRKRNFLLHHGTLLYDFPLERIGRYLYSPARQPDYRQNRDHTAFVTNLPAQVPDLRRRLQTAWQADGALGAWPEESVRRLVEEKYATPAWVRRR